MLVMLSLPLMPLLADLDSGLLNQMRRFNSFQGRMANHRSSDREVQRTSTGKYVRPLKGRCPGCNKPENKQCERTCPYVDPRR